MDPQTTLINCERDVKVGAWRSALQCLLDYYAWRLAGGHQPAYGGIGGDLKAMELATKIQDGLEEAF